MFFVGKILGALFGTAAAGFIGGLFGPMLGHFFDMRLKVALQQGQPSESTFRLQELFFKTTFEVMGYLAKVDGRVSEHEIHAARAIMQQLDLDDAQRLQAIDHFNRGKQKHFDLKAALLPFKQVIHRQRHLLQMFLEIQLALAYADGHVPDAQQKVLERICEILQIPQTLLRILEKRYQAERHFHQKPSYHKDELKDAYGVLGVNSQSTQKEVKKAYRKLMSEHHPDKLAAKGLPESMRPIAKEKTQKIQMAYEVIGRAKGWS